MVDRPVSCLGALPVSFDYRSGELSTARGLFENASLCSSENRSSTVGNSGVGSCHDFLGMQLGFELTGGDFGREWRPSS